MKYKPPEQLNNSFESEEMSDSLPSEKIKEVIKEVIAPSKDEPAKP